MAGTRTTHRPDLKAGRAERCVQSRKRGPPQCPPGFPLREEPNGEGQERHGPQGHEGHVDGANERGEGRPRTSPSRQGSSRDGRRSRFPGIGPKTLPGSPRSGRGQDPPRLTRPGRTTKRPDSIFRPRHRCYGATTRGDAKQCPHARQGDDALVVILHGDGPPGRLQEGAATPSGPPANTGRKRSGRRSGRTEARSRDRGSSAGAGPTSVPGQRRRNRPGGVAETGP